MEKNSSLLVIAILVGAILAIFYVEWPNNARSQDACLEPYGCLIIPSYEVKVTEQGNVHNASIKLVLSKEEAALLDEHDAIRKLRSLLVTAYSGGTWDCSYVEDGLNAYLTTVLVSPQAWDEVSSGRDPVSVCEE